VTGLAPEPVDRAIARILAGGLDQPPRAEIDPNVRVRGNQTFTTFSCCDRVPLPGEHVTVYEPESGVEGPAVVTDVDDTKRLVYLKVDWERLL